MPAKTKNNEQELSESRLLTSAEQAACEKIAAANEALHSQRAQALLALDQGSSQTEAGQQAGLTPGQVRYCLNKFRQQRLGIFPDHLAGDEQPKAAAPPESADSPEPEGAEAFEPKPEVTKTVADVTDTKEAPPETEEGAEKAATAKQPLEEKAKSEQDQKTAKKSKSATKMKKAKKTKKAKGKKTRSKTKTQKKSKKKKAKKDKQVKQPKKAKPAKKNKKRKK